MLIILNGIKLSLTLICQGEELDMSNEYVLQKKTLGGWSYVTWYTDVNEALRNLKAAVADGYSGYSWRVVELKVIEEVLNKDELEALPTEKEEAVEPVKSGWGKPTGAAWGVPAPKAEHGLAGKVWLANRELKEKRRVDPSEVEVMMAQGWFKAGPRTVL